LDAINSVERSANDVFVMNVHASTEDKVMTERTVSMRNQIRHSMNYLRVTRKFLYDKPMQNQGEKIFSNRQLKLRLQENGNGAEVANFAATEHLSFKSTAFPHRNIHKYTWTSDGKTDHMLTHKKLHKVYMMYALSEKLTVILITVW